MATFELIRGVRVGSEVLTKKETITEEETVKLDIEVAESTVLQEHQLGIDISEIKALYCGVDQLGTMRINTNGASPIALDPELPLLWSYGNGDNPLGVADITSVFITNSCTTADMILNFRALLNSRL